MLVKKISLVVMLVACAAWTGRCLAEDKSPLVEMESGIASEYGGRLADKAKADFKDAQVKIEPDADKAVGLFNPTLNEGIIVVPMKGWKEDRDNKAVDTECGAPMCYVFMSPRYNPLLDGKAIDGKKFRKVKYSDPDGNEKEATCLICSVKHGESDDWKLHIYGTDKKPLIESPIGEAADAPKGDLAIAVKDPTKDGKASLVFTLFGKYGSELTIGHKH